MVLSILASWTRNSCPLTGRGKTSVTTRIMTRHTATTLRSTRACRTIVTMCFIVKLRSIVDLQLSIDDCLSSDFPNPHSEIRNPQLKSLLRTALPATKEDPPTLEGAWRPVLDRVRAMDGQPSCSETSRGNNALGG